MLKGNNSMKYLAGSVTSVDKDWHVAIEESIINVIKSKSENNSTVMIYSYFRYCPRNHGT